MIPLAFIGGALVGAAGLLAVALRDGDDAGSALPSSVKHPERLDEREVVSLLAGYTRAANKLSAKCNTIEMESSDLVMASISLEDDDLLQKMSNVVEDGLTRVGRTLRCSQLNDLKDEASRLYGTYRGVFRRANALLCERGGENIDLRPIRFESKEISVNNALDNDDWCHDFGKAVDSVRNVLETSSTIAGRLIDLLEEMDTPSPAGDGRFQSLALPKAG